jgi:para-nitrobenzyl esterase
MRQLFLSLLFLVVGTITLGAQSFEVIKLNSGTICGNYNQTSKVYAFKGIPYAKIPVGELRWKSPQPVESWQGIKECKNFSASAMQGHPAPFSMWTSEFIAPESPLSEDCLYLNVWTSTKSDNNKLPVMVYIHGGAFVAGSGSVPVYDGEPMAKKGVVFVTINYRLGIFGFLAHPELSKESESHTSGNYGLLDQIASLKWVRANISAFGGNPNNITIVGQSAGAQSVNYLVSSPLAKGLFHRAIAESGGNVLHTSTTRSTTLAEAEESCLKWASGIHAQTIADLRKLSVDELLKANYSPRPIIDGYSIPEEIGIIFSKGLQNDVPILIGWNANEGNFLGDIPNSKAFIERAQSMYGEKADKFLEYFPATNDSITEQSQLKYSALLAFGVQSFQWMTLQNKTGKSDVYLYHFIRKVPYGIGQSDFGAFHSSEIPYALHNLHVTTVRPWTDADYTLESVMSDYWVNFAKSGNPNGENLPNWKPCKLDTLNTMILGENQKLSIIPNKAELEFLRDFFDMK